MIKAKKIAKLKQIKIRNDSMKQNQSYIKCTYTVGSRKWSSDSVNQTTQYNSDQLYFNISQAPQAPL